MADSIIERVARAICKSEGYDPDYEGQHGVSWKEFSDHARAAIEAMMEPSKAMVFFGMDAMSRDDLEPTEDEFRAGFQAAIRSALGTTFPALSPSPSLKEQERT